jgi:transposase InsO family protein
VRYACIRQYEGTFTVVLMCRVLGVARAGYYAWRQRPPSARAQRDTQLRVVIRAIHAASQRRYGRPRVHRELRDSHQIRCSPKRVARLMRLDGLRGKRARRFRTTTQSDGTPPAPNHLGRRFHVTGLNRVWASDVTACPTAQGWLYLAVVLDLASRRVVGWAAGATVGQELTLAALRQALAHRTPPRGLLHHSDRGMHYTGTSYQRLLAAHGGIASMSRRGDCWDNAVVESFFATLKTELVADASWRSRADGIDALRQYLAWYNRQRLHSTLHYVSPADFERQLTAA